MPNARIFPFSLLLTLSVALLAVEHNRIPLDQQTRPGSRPLLPPHGENRKKFPSLIFLPNQVVISTLTFIISTAEELQEDEEGRVDFPRIMLIIDLIDNIVVIFFTIEFLTRLLVCPNKKR